MKRLVLDASVALKWLVAEEGSELASGLRGRATFIAPDLLLSECANALWKKARRGEIDAGDADLAVRMLERVDVDFRSARSLIRPALALSRTFDHPVYDCVYLALAQAEEVPLVTADARLATKMRAAPLEGVSVLTLSEALA